LRASTWSTHPRRKVRTTRAAMAVAPPAVAPRGAARVARADVGQQQVQLRLAVPAPSLLAPDRYAMVVLNGLTGGPTGPLFRALRSERGLAPRPGTRLGATPQPGATGDREDGRLTGTISVATLAAAWQQTSDVCATPLRPAPSERLTWCSRSRPGQHRTASASSG
jgi:hypothetical protein